MKIWIDLCHTPHVPFFVPQIRELSRLRYETTITVRDSFQICELLDLAGVKSYHKIGRHYGKRPIMKGVGLLIRAMQLYWFARKRNFSIAISHGSPFQILAAFLLDIPSLAFDDYEHSFWSGYKLVTKVALPKFIPDEVLVEKGVDLRKVIKYPGIKEDVYIQAFEPDSTILDELNIDPKKIIVTLRPPATEAHYHNPQSESLFESVVEFLGHNPEARLVILPRDRKQNTSLKKIYQKWCAKKKIIIPNHAIDGLNLIWHSDLVISGGGTMNREATALGVPVYSIFRGRIGAVDKYLAKSGRLVLIKSVEDVQTKIVLKRRYRPSSPENANRAVLERVVGEIISMLEDKRQKIVKVA